MKNEKPSFERLRASSEPIYDMIEDIPAEALRAFDSAMGEYIRNGIHGLWLEPEAHDGHTDPHQLVFRIGERHSQLALLFGGDDVRSPIEQMLIGALLWLEMDWAGFPEFFPHEYAGRGHQESGAQGSICFHFDAQAKIASYKVDFVLWFERGKTTGGVVIECDGHDFHERTKEQAARDKKRDRELLAQGYPVVRFTGSEIYANPVACVEQVRGILSDVLDRVSREGGGF